MHLQYVSFNVPDVERSCDFYIGLLGMSRQGSIDLGNGITETLLGCESAVSAPGAGIILMHDANRDKPYERGNAFSRIIFNVPDIAGMIERLQAAGVRVVKPPTQVESQNLVYALVKDPDGFLVELLESRRR
ncbi:lactoylglutathione lyase [Povalibacter uvarum]|uniref:Aldoketomutase n=1 Tax=Povalibacter uvarum TaxID=732238 RepID=A0A841HHX6_9GAMM|nr:VOC family protein [Povalibacter uvarum]MBB6092174.1 lactoylglutathione lyase [Povalibacter uvarum]